MVALLLIDIALI